jgi:hypothetical protein
LWSKNLSGDNYFVFRLVARTTVLQDVGLDVAVVLRVLAEDFRQGSLLPVPDPFGNHNGPLERHTAVSGRRSEPQYLQQRSKAYLGANSGLIRKQFGVITWISDLGWESAATTVLGQSALNRVRESPYSWTAGPGAERFSPEMVSIKSTNFSPSPLSAALRKKTANSRVIHNYRD